MFALSRRFGALADRYGPRFFMGAGPLVAAAGIFLLLGVGIQPSYVGEVLPAMVVFSLGLALTVAPLVATVLADADVSDAGIASAINNAVARIGGLLAIAVLPAAAGITVGGSGVDLDSGLDMAMLISGAASALCYAMLFAYEKEVMASFTRTDGWYPALPVLTAFVFSFAHGAFTAYFWEVLGVKARPARTDPEE